MKKIIEYMPLSKYSSTSSQNIYSWKQTNRKNETVHIRDRRGGGMGIVVLTNDSN